MWPLFIVWEAGFWNVLSLLVVLALILVFMNAFNFYVNEQKNIPIRDATKAHNWQSQRVFQSCLCNICEFLLFRNEGFYCDCCGICADQVCLRKANMTLECKKIAIENQATMKHQWVKGNLPEGSVCYVCEEECLLEEPNLVDYRCVWCHRLVHTDCLPAQLEDCDMGKNKNFIIPPNNVVLNYRRSRVGWRLRLKAVTDSAIQDWMPLFVLGNRKSGNNRGGEILSGFRSMLNALQVVDLSERSPSALYEWVRLLPSTAKPVLLVAGGDGTAAWVLTTLHHIKTDLPVAILPLGTGNDLSRVLGWGKEEPKPFSVQQILDSIKLAKPAYLDRWNVNITGARHFGHFGRISKSYYMYNYLSVGVDAQVALNFHRTRQSPFYIVSNRIFNKMLYLLFGTQQVMERGCRNLENRLELYMDNKLVELPSIESIVILNIPSWGAGVNLWNVGCDDEEGLPEQSFSDGKLEVVAIYSSFHIAQLQVGLSKPHRIGQAKSVKIKLKSKSPMQVDGEPWVQQPAEICVNFENKAKVMLLEQNQK